MKTDLYNKIMLTIIAICLVALVIQNQTARHPQSTFTGALDVNIVGVTKELPVSIQSQKSDSNPKSPLEVKIVGTSGDIPVAIQNQKGFEFPKEPIDINIKSVGGDTLRRVGNQVVLPVGVENTVGVDVKGLNGKTMKSGLLSAGSGAAGFPVVILNK